MSDNPIPDKIIDVPNKKIKRVLILNKSKDKIWFDFDIKNNGDAYLTLMSLGAKE